jgi:hypothetical protein
MISYASSADSEKKEKRFVAPFARKRVMAHKQPRYESRGQPTKYKPEYCEALIDYMAKGFTLTAFAGSIRVSRETVYAWMSEHSDFSDAATRGKAAASNAWEARMMEAKRSAEAATSIFALKNINPDDWKEVRHNNLEVTHKLDQMTDAQLLAIMQGKSSAAHVVLDVKPLVLEHVKDTADSDHTPTRRKD